MYSRTHDGESTPSSSQSPPRGIVKTMSTAAWYCLIPLLKYLDSRSTNMLGYTVLSLSFSNLTYFMPKLYFLCSVGCVTQTSCAGPESLSGVLSVCVTQTSCAGPGSLSCTLSLVSLRQVAMYRVGGVNHFQDQEALKCVVSCVTFSVQLCKIREPLLCPVNCVTWFSCYKVRRAFTLLASVCKVH